MSNNHVEDGDVEGAEVIDKRDVASNDLSKMSHDDDCEDSGKNIDMSLLENKKAEPKKIVIKREDIKFIVDQLELPSKVVETKLVEHDGDVIKALTDLMGFAS